MYQVTKAFHETIRSQKRRTVARCIIDYTDPIIDQSIEVEVNERAYISYPTQTADGVTSVPYLWAVLDDNWILGEPWRLMPDSPDQHQVGWWGEQLADVNGDFAPPYPQLTVTHVPRPIHTLLVVGDSARREYPVDFKVELFSLDNILLYSKTVSGNSEIEWSLELPSPILNVAKQVLTITKWSHPGKQVKIVEFFSSIQQTYEGDMLISVRLLEEREVSQGSLPIGNISANEITVRLANDDKRFDPDNDTSPLYGLIKANRRIRAWIGADMEGEIEWVPLGVFWATDWDSDDATLETTVRGLDRLESLRQTTYRTSVPMENMTASALAQEILEDAGLTPADYIIDSELDDIVFPWAWMPAVSHREALRLLAEACMAVVYCDRDGRVRIARPIEMVQGEKETYFLQGPQYPADVEDTGIYGIGPDDYFSIPKTPTSKDEVANTIVVTTQPVRPVEDFVEVFRANSPIVIGANEIVKVTIQYSKQPVIDATAALDDPPPGVGIISAEHYSWGADIEIENTSGAEVDVMLVVLGKPLEIYGGEQIVEWDELSVRDDGELKFEFPSNHLVQTSEQAQAIAKAILASAKVLRRDIEFEWRGNPALELGDVVLVVTDAVNDRRSIYTIIRQEIEWAGYLSARSKGRRLL